MKSTLKSVFLNRGISCFRTHEIWYIYFWKSPKAYGYGKSVGKNTYEGNFVQGYMHGKGIYTWSDGTFYNGEFENDEAKDVGILFEDVYYWYKMGNFLYSQGRLNDAIDIYRSQLKIKPDHEKTWYRVGAIINLFTKQKRNDEAIKTCNRLIEEHPKNKYLLLGRAILSDKIGRTEQFKQDLKLKTS
ncbi:MAG: tetratricopeptide repeat protein [Desulfobacteraceae bacterium]|nr:tetratricopeptide repeat protein [Desulfobacteraceae bacterium]